MNLDEARAVLREHGQEHLLKYYDQLSAQEREGLLKQIAGINFSVFHALDAGGERKIGKLSPVPAVTVHDVELRRAEFEDIGLAAIRAGKVAAVLLAGGQGTRLGSDNPKGMFNIGVTRELSIFEQQFVNISEVTRKAGACFHIFIMTSEVNNSATVQFFRQKNFFGYPPEKVHFFVQDMAATCDLNGKIFLEEKGRISMSPNGNGGWYASLLKNGEGDILSREGIEWLNVYSVDNVLQRICDPVFVGATINGGAGCGAKVVKKVAPEEKVGVLCMEDGAPAIVEYYEMPPELASLRRPDGELKFPYGVILNYLFRVDLLNKTTDKRLPVHLSLKKIPHIEDGVLVKPEEPNGYKFEYLVLDMIKLMGSCLAVEVVREKEFAPVKNRTGTDSVDTARALLVKNGVKL